MFDRCTENKINICTVVVLIIINAEFTSKKFIVGIYRVSQKDTFQKLAIILLLFD